MDAYYRQQSQLPHFGGYSRQRGSGIGALVAGVGRIALPFIRKVVLPIAKQFGREFLSQGVPQVLDVVAKRKTPKQALKSTLSNTVRKQIGGGGRVPTTKRKQPRRASRPKRKPRRQSVRVRKTATKRKASIPAKSTAKRSRLNFFTNIKNDY